MKPIDTWYKGRCYRSRLEARWAVFFDALAVRFDYEPEGFRFADGTMYLPDFWLFEHNCWVEIKPNAGDTDKARLLASEGRANVWVFVGSPTPDDPPRTIYFCGARFDDGFVEDYYEDQVWWNDFEEDDVRAAMEAATAARFEFGEEGRPHGMSTVGDLLRRQERGRIGSAIRRGEFLGRIQDAVERLAFDVRQIVKTNPNISKAGVRMRMNARAAAVDAAIEHAKERGWIAVDLPSTRGKPPTLRFLATDDEGKVS